MSWQTYVDDHLMCEIGRGKRLTAAAIIGQDGSVWAQSDSFPAIKLEEVMAIVNDFAKPGSLAPTGLYIGGTKYMVIQGEPGAVIRGKKVNDFASFAPRQQRRLQIGATEYEVIQGNDCGETRFLAPGRVTIGGTKYKVIQGETGPATRGKKIEPEKVTGIVNDFADPESTEMHIGGTNYTIIQGDPGAFTRGKKGSAGVNIKKTTCALIFGLYDEPVTPGDCNRIVGRIGDYLIDQGI